MTQIQRLSRKFPSLRKRALVGSLPVQTCLIRSKQLTYKTLDTFFVAVLFVHEKPYNDASIFTWDFQYYPAFFPHHFRQRSVPTFSCVMASDQSDDSIPTSAVKISIITRAQWGARKPTSISKLAEPVTCKCGLYFDNLITLSGKKDQEIFHQ